MTINNRTIETADGMRYEVEHCLQAMNRFERGSKEYKIFSKVFVWICRKASREAYDGIVFKSEKVFKI